MIISNFVAGGVTMNREEIVAVRKSLELSQEKFAQLLGVSSKTISRWELGEGSPPPKSLTELNNLATLVKDPAKKKELVELYQKTGDMSILKSAVTIGVAALLAPGIAALAGGVIGCTALALPILALIKGGKKK